MAEDTFYDVLGLSRGASDSDIKSAYKKLLHTVHPDKDGGNSYLFRRVQEAWSILGIPALRREYDASLGEARDTPPDAGRQEPSEGREAPSAEGWPRIPPVRRSQLQWLNHIKLDAPVRVEPHFIEGWGRMLVWSGAITLVMGILAVLTLVGHVYLAFLGSALLGIGSGFMVRRSLAQRKSALELDAEMSRPLVLESNLYGRPGGTGRPLSGKERYVRSLTGRVVEPLVSLIPGAKLLHMLESPNGDIVDHGVLVGHRLVLMSGQVSPPGKYTCDSYGDLLCDGNPVPFEGAELELAAKEWRRALPGVEVAPVLVLHQASPGTLRVVLPSQYPLTVIPAEELLQVVGEWLAPEAGVIDRFLLRRLLRAVR